MASLLFERSRNVFDKLQCFGFAKANDLPRGFQHQANSSISFRRGGRSTIVKNGKSAFFVIPINVANNIAVFHGLFLSVSAKTHFQNRVAPKVYRADQQNAVGPDEGVLGWIFNTVNL